MYSNYAINISVIRDSMMAASTKTLKFISRLTVLSLNIIKSAKLRVLRAHVATCLACLRDHLPTCLVCLRAYVPCVLLAQMHYVPKCTRAIASNSKNKFSKT